MITPLFWQRMGFAEEPDIKIGLPNLSKAKISYKNFINQHLTIIVYYLKF
jgi:hypothetical protein